MGSTSGAGALSSLPVPLDWHCLHSVYCTAVHRSWCIAELFLANKCIDCTKLACVLCRCRLSECQYFRKVQTCQARRSVMSRCQLGVAAYTPLRTDMSHIQACVTSPIEEQLSAQHQNPAELLDLRRQDGSLLVDDNTALFEDLTRTTTVTPHAAGGVILGFSVANGAVASQDFPIGKVQKLT